MPESCQGCPLGDGGVHGDARGGPETGDPGASLPGHDGALWLVSTVRMTPELIAIISASIALAGLILISNRRTESRLGERIDRVESRLGARIEGVESRIERVESSLNGLRERMAHLEGLLEGLREAITRDHAA